MVQYALILDLKDDPALISEYDEHHRKVWPEILASIKEAGIEHMDIYRWNNRLFMLLKVTEHFSFEKKAALDESNQKVQQWEELMWKYQQKLPGSKPGEKWQLMHKIFDI